MISSPSLQPFPPITSGPYSNWSSEPDLEKFCVNTCHVPWQFAKSEKLQEAFFPSDLPMCFTLILGNIFLCAIWVLAYSFKQQKIQFKLTSTIRKSIASYNCKSRKQGRFQGQFNVVALDLFLCLVLRGPPVLIASFFMETKWLQQILVSHGNAINVGEVHQRARKLLS